jgi:hypothetical protein
MKVEWYPIDEDCEVENDVFLTNGRNVWITDQLWAYKDHIERDTLRWATIEYPDPPDLSMLSLTDL